MSPLSIADKAARKEKRLKEKQKDLSYTKTQLAKKARNDERKKKKDFDFSSLAGKKVAKKKATKKT